MHREKALALYLLALAILIALLAWSVRVLGSMERRRSIEILRAILLLLLGIPTLIHLLTDYHW